MATKQTKAKPPTLRELTVTATEGKTPEQTIALVLLDPVVIAGCFLADQNKNNGPNVDIQAFVEELRRHAAIVRGGDLSRGEEMLTAQAHSLNSLFYSLANRAAANSKEGYLTAAESYMKLAMRAQAQCRSTWEAIAEIKNPRQVAFVKQTNMGNNVQVNNGNGPTELPSRTEKTQIEQNKLLEATNGERLDTRTKGAPGRVNPELESVGAINGTANPQRQATD